MVLKCKATFLNFIMFLPHDLYSQSSMYQSFQSLACIFFIQSSYSFYFTIFTHHLSNNIHQWNAMWWTLSQYHYSLSITIFQTYFHSFVPIAHMLQHNSLHFSLIKAKNEITGQPTPFLLLWQSKSIMKQLISLGCLYSISYREITTSHILQHRY